MKNGKGFLKEYYYDKEIHYEGEYLNGDWNGKGKEYSRDEELLFEGEFKNGKRWNGKGYYRSNNIAYELRNGQGLVKEFFYEGKYAIEFLDLYEEDNRNEDNDLIFEGMYINGEKNGKAKEFSFKKLMFEGEYLNGKRNGIGKEYYYNGKLKFEGEYLYGFKLRGKEYFEGRLEYEGEYLYGKKFEGKGYDEKGNIIYELNNGNGKVKEYDNKGYLEFEGEYIKGKKSGKGKEFKRHFCTFYGEYLDGKRWNGIGKKYSIFQCDKEVTEFEYINGKIYNMYSY